MIDKLMLPATVGTREGDGVPYIEWNGTIYFANNKADVEQLATMINHLRAVATPVVGGMAAVVEGLPAFPRYNSGYIDDYRDGGHSGCKEQADGELIDVSSFDYVVKLLAEAQDTQTRMQHVLDRRDARIQGLLDIIRAVGMLGDEGTAVPTSELEDDLNRLNARISDNYSLLNPPPASRAERQRDLVKDELVRFVHTISGTVGMDADAMTAELLASLQTKLDAVK